MDGEEFNLRWEEEVVIKNSPSHSRADGPICSIENIQSYGNMQSEIDQIAAENLMYLAQDVVSFVDPELDPNVECVTEEVITDDWVTPGGQERVEVPIDQLTHPVLHIKEENDVDVPLPTDQDEYTAMRPWPCDFCSRRFRKKAALMNHMVAHQNDRPHACNLCGVRYVRKCDLMNHLKVHAYVPEDADEMDFVSEDVEKNQNVKPKKKRGRRKKNSETIENGWENMTSARTQQWSRRARSPPRPPPTPPSPPTAPSPVTPPPRPAHAAHPTPPADPSRPFVCRHCGIGFAREKALQSHARVHGGDSPVECGECGELCWSREALASHTRHRHPHVDPQRALTPELKYEADSGDDMDYQLSPASVSEGRGGGSTGRPVYDTIRGPELFCPDCGVAFQRADLLRRHVAAAHSYKRHENSGSWAEHTCEVCGAACTDALQLLAHAELHADRDRDLPPHNNRVKRTSKGRSNASSSNIARQFPCRECGKVFGSRSSQQIHIRIHTGERPYACRFCWKAFADGGTLRKHERIHTGEKPYACAVCPRAFNQRVVLREHVRSHHSAPDRCTNGGPAYICVVCGRTLHSSNELVQHLIQHCDANTAMKRQPQSGPRKYKRRRKMSMDSSPVHNWESSSPPPASPPPSPPPPDSPPPRASRPRRTRLAHARRTKRQMRSRRTPRHPADDLREIARSPSPVTPRTPEPMSPEPPPPSAPADESRLFKCEMCSLEFARRDDLLLHVPVHI